MKFSRRSPALLLLPVVFSAVLLPITSVHALNDAETGQGSAGNYVQQQTEHIVDQSTICCSCHPTTGADIVVRFDRHDATLRTTTCEQFGTQEIYNRDSQPTICAAAKQMLRGSTCRQVGDSPATCPPLTNAAGAICGAPAMGETPVAINPQPSTGASEGTVEFRSLKPVLSVPIPGVNFTDATLQNGVVTVPFLAQYILGVYKFAIGAAALLASIMVVYGGFRYLLGATAGDIKTGKETIQNAVIGLIVLLCSYVILKSLNPALVDLQAISLSYQERVTLPPGSGGSGEDGGAGPTCLNGNGRYWGRMHAVCAPANTAALDGIGKLKLFRQIVDVWKRVGIDEHGAIYVWGGSSDCHNARANAIDKNNIDHYADVMFKMRQIVPLENLGLSPGCLASFSANHEADQGVACYQELYDRFKAVWLPRYQAAGLYCNDCNGMVHSIYNCYGGRPAYDLVGDIGSACRANGVFKFTGDTPSDDQIRQGISQLHFGDLIHDNANGHAYLYTGKAGLPYEIMEMGTTGPGDGRIASSAPRNYLNLGYANASVGGGMAIYRDAFTYIKHKARTLHEKPSTCITGIHALSDIPEAAYQTLLTTPLEPFQLPANPPQVTQTPETNGCVAAPSAGGGAGGSGIGAAGATEGGVTSHTFNYTPTNIGWRANQSVIMYPERLTREFASIASGGTRPTIHVYMYLHGAEGDGAAKPPDQAAYFTRLHNALATVAGSKNILIIAPHYFGGSGQTRDFMNGLSIRSFYRAAVDAFVANVPGARTTDIVDSVVSGHSRANCHPGVLSQAETTPLENQRGIVLYDGCLGGDGDAVQPSTYRIPTPGDGTGSLYFNTDARGQTLNLDHIGNVKTKWGLTDNPSCPEYVNRIASGTLCKSRLIPATDGNPRNNREIFQFVTHAGHGESVEPMTRMMFNAFYR